MTDQPQYPSYPGPEQPATPAPGQVPPPPPGYQSPPGPEQPPAYGQAPPPGYVPSDWGQPPAPSRYVSWFIRVGGFLLDQVIHFAFGFVTGFVIGIALVATCPDKLDDNLVCTDSLAGNLPNILRVIIYVIPLLAVLANFVVLQGLRGQSLGKMIVGSKVIRISTGQPMGFWLALARYLLFVLVTLCTCFLNLFWPLWDAKNQGLHDKIVGTIVVPSR